MKRWTEATRGVLLKIAYDGRNYSGLAIQSNATTVAGQIARALALMDPEASPLRVCSRTDAGVHAKQQYVCFDTDKEISMRGWLLGLTGELDDDIAILSAARVSAGFQPSNHATCKTYCYRILQGTIRDPFHAGRSWRVFERLNHTEMARGAERLLGTHDFQAFRGRGDVRENTVRSITGVAVAPSGHHERLLEIRVTGNAFLYHMVRIIAGTLVDIGRAKLDPDAITRAIETGDRLELGVTAPAAGLFLEQIVLDECGEDEWPYHLDGAPIEARKRT